MIHTRPEIVSPIRSGGSRSGAAATIVALGTGPEWRAGRRIGIEETEPRRTPPARSQAFREPAGFAAIPLLAKAFPAPQPSIS